MRRILGGCALVLVTLLAGCGGGGSDGGSKSSDAFGDQGNYPKCSDVWVDGKTIPKKYEGCASDDGNTIEAGVSFDCGTFDLYTYEPKGNGFYTDESGKIVEAGADYANTPEYGALYDKCT